jgi:hypothetical protein
MVQVLRITSALNLQETDEAAVVALRRWRFHQTVCLWRLNSEQKRAFEFEN